MDALFADLGRRYRFNESLLGLVTKGFTAADWSFVPSGGGGNAPHWILGHVAATRRELLRMLGADVEQAPWEACFGSRAKPTGSEGYPEPSALIADVARSGERVASVLGALTAEAAAREWGGSLPDGSKTAGGAAGFLYMHECYHLGQLGLLRRIRGYPGFA